VPSAALWMANNGDDRCKDGDDNDEIMMEMTCYHGDDNDKTAASSNNYDGKQH